jgi:hypothetical protein
MQGYVEVQDAPPVVFHREEAVQGTEREARNCEEVECGDDFSMVVQKSEPLFGFALVWRALETLQIAGHGGFGDLESQ